MDLRYCSIVAEMLRQIPELQESYEALQDQIGPEVLPYMVVGLVLEPFIKNALQEHPDDALLRRSFLLLEQMARSSDVEVANLLWVEIFEMWMADQQTLRKAWSHMGRETRTMDTDAARRLGCTGNLPPFGNLR